MWLVMGEAGRSMGLNTMYLRALYLERDREREEDSPLEGLGREWLWAARCLSYALAEAQPNPAILRDKAERRQEDQGRWEREDSHHGKPPSPQTTPLGGAEQGGS